MKSRKEQTCVSRSPPSKYCLSDSFWLFFDYIFLSLAVMLSELLRFVFSALRTLGKVRLDKPTGSMAFHLSVLCTQDILSREEIWLGGVKFNTGPGEVESI